MNFGAVLTFLNGLLLILSIFGNHFGSISCYESPSKRHNKHKGTVTTYKNEYDDIFDCVNLYQQPAFDHPLSVNHTIKKLSPKWFPKQAYCPLKRSEVPNKKNITQHCPKGTIPIIRSNKHDSNVNVNTFQVNPIRREYAFVETQKGGQRVFGAGATLEVHNPHVAYKTEYSLAQVSIGSHHGTPRQISLEAGWIVSKYTTGHMSIPTKFFIRWTGDGYRNIGCFDLNCPGFVQTKQIEIDGILSVDTPLVIAIVRSEQMDWWLFKNCEEVGYWPSYLFPTLLDGAESAVFGGEIVNKNIGHHTTTQMGTGRFGDKGEFRAAAINFIQTIPYINSLPIKLGEHEVNMNKPNCYNVMVQNSHPLTGGFSLYYGGPGHNRVRNCV